MICNNCKAQISDQSTFCPQCGADVATQGEVLSVWPEWRIVGQIGRGSYGTVYKAVRTDSRVESYAAIKKITIPTDTFELDSLRSEGLGFDESRTYLKGVVDDFVGEIRLMESLKGVQNIVSVEDYKVIEKTNEIGWEIYIRMELLTPFHTYMCDKTLSEIDVLKLGCDICTALEICSKRNVIHRDIKPENIFINDFGHFKLGDFGIARKMENVSGGLSQKGTFNYMAPEVAASNRYDARADIYSLGIVLYRLLNNNKLPFLDTDKQLLSPHERRNAVERRLRGESLPIPCGASPHVAQAVLRACAFRPEDRYADASQMKKALLAIINNTGDATAYAPPAVAPSAPPRVEPAQVPAPAPAPRAVTYVPAQNAPRAAKPNIALIVALTAVFALLIVLLVVVLLDSRRDKPELNDDPQIPTTTSVFQVTSPTTVVTTTNTTVPPTTVPTNKGVGSDSTYLIPDSNSRYLTQAEVDVMSTEWLIYSINEIYARHGYIFKDSDFANYFMTKSWYSPSVSSMDAVLAEFNQYEKKNVDLLKTERKTRPD